MENFIIRITIQVIMKNSSKGIDTKRTKAYPSVIISMVQNTGDNIV